jgi:dienelactone hydrolase
MTTTKDVTIPPLGLAGILRLPPNPRGVIVFAHGSGSSRHSVRNNRVAEALAEAGFASLLMDLLAEEEEADRTNVFDIPLLAQRLIGAIGWLSANPGTSRLPVGLFGASTGAAAALVAAADLGGGIRAVVSRGGRPDLAAGALAKVHAPVLLIVGGSDIEVLRLNEFARDRIAGLVQLEIVPGATHLFEEPGTLDAVAALATAWFRRWL